MLGLRFSHRVFLPACLLVALASCGRRTNETYLRPSTETTLRVPYTALTPKDLALIAQRSDENSINPATDKPIVNPSALELLVTTTFWNHHQQYGFADVDLSKHLPPIRDQLALPICSPLTDIDLVSTAFLDNGTSLSAMDVFRKNDPQMRYISFDAKQDSLLDLAKGGQFLTEASMPLDERLFTKENNFYRDFESNFLKKGKLYFKKFVTPFYEIPSEAILKNEFHLDESTLAKLKLDSHALKNKAKESQQVIIPPFKISQFSIDFEDSLMEGQRPAITWAIESVFKSLFEEHRPVRTAVCFLDIQRHTRSYEPEGAKAIADNDLANTKDNCGWHAMLIVGIKSINHRTYLKLRNTHGLSFGAQGYTLIAVDLFFKSTIETAKGLKFTFISSKQKEHQLISERFYYQGPLTSFYLPEGSGKISSFYGGKIYGDFHQGTCSECHNDNFIWPYAYSGSFKQSTSPSIELKVNSTTNFAKWETLYTPTQPGDIYYVNASADGSLITKVEAEGNQFYHNNDKDFPPLKPFTPTRDP